MVLFLKGNVYRGKTIHDIHIHVPVHVQRRTFLGGWGFCGYVQEGIVREICSIALCNMWL